MGFIKSQYWTSNYINTTKEPKGTIKSQYWDLIEPPPYLPNIVHYSDTSYKENENERRIKDAPMLWIPLRNQLLKILVA